MEHADFVINGFKFLRLGIEMAKHNKGTKPQSRKTQILHKVRLHQHGRKQLLELAPSLVHRRCFRCGTP